MPNLGSFLKKKRTKDLAYPTDSISANSNSGNSPTTPTSSGGFRDVTATTITPSQPTQSQHSHVPVDESSSVQGQAPTSAPRSAEQDVTISHPQHQNVPSIKNLINPPQTDGAGQSQTGGQRNELDAKPAEAKSAEVASTPAVRPTKGKYTLSDFAIQRTLGTGSFGRVHLVQSNHNQRFYAVKVLKKQQVVKMKQVEHTNDERRMLQRVKHAFLITLWGTFQDSKNLYMVMDFVEGGELFSLLRKSQVGHIYYCVYTDGSGSFFWVHALTVRKAFPQPRGEILCSRSDFGFGLSPFHAYHIPRSKARKPPAGQAWSFEDHRLWLRKRSPRHHMDSLRNSRLSCARSCGLKRLQQICRLVFRRS